MGKILDFFNNLRIRPGPGKLSVTAIRRSINIFSCICGVFVFLVGFFLAYKFFGINNTVALIVLLAGFLFALIVRRIVFNIGVRRAKKKHSALLNDLVVIKWGVKKIFGFSLLTILSSSLLFVVFIVLVVPNIDVVSADSIILGAHRGDSVKYIENTLPAILSAVENDDYKFIEFDVQYTKDKVLIVHHDVSLIRMQYKYYYISDLTYEELLEVSDYHIPLYSEVMEIAAEKKPLNIEIKSQGNLEDNREIADFIVNDTKSRGIFNLTLFSSVESDVLRYFDEVYPEAKTGKIYWVSPGTFLNFDDVIEDMYIELENIGADYLMLHASNLRNYHALQRLKPVDKDIVIWYFNNEMYIIPSEGHDLLDDDGNIVGYVVKDLETKIGSWDVLFGSKKILGRRSKVNCWWGKC
jgi:glycerophosphoryl diester phosphodiesterase